MKRLAATAALAMTVSGCQWAPGSDQSLIKDAEQRAAAELRDPSSAQFRNVRRHGKYVCGEINGKNGFGAYAGFSKFVVGPDDVTLAPQATDADSEQIAAYFNVIWIASCGTE